MKLSKTDVAAIIGGLVVIALVSWGLYLAGAPNHVWFVCDILKLCD